MSFGQSVKSVFRQYATFSGRARRSEYWWFYLFSSLVSLPGSIIFTIAYFAALIPAMSDNSYADGTLRDDWYQDINSGLLIGGAVPMILVGLALFVPGLALMVRRLHDTGRSGWWYFIAFVPLGSYVLLVFMFFDSQPYDNIYGPDPKAGTRYTGGFPPVGYAQPAQGGYPAAPHAYPAYPVQPGYPAAPPNYQAAPPSYQAQLAVPPPYVPPAPPGAANDPAAPST